MKKILIIVLGSMIAGLYLVSAAAAKTDNAPGQLKKTENSYKTQNQAADKPVTSVTKTDPPGLLKKPSPTAQPLPTANAKQVESFVAVKSKGKAPEKIGAAKLRNILTEGTSSATLSGVRVKKAKMTLKTATAGAQLKRHAVMGVITAITDGIITISHQTQTGRTWIIYYNAATVITMKGIETPTAANLTAGMRIAAVGEVAPENGILAKRIHVIPGKAGGLTGRVPIATPSAAFGTPAPTATATPSLSPTATPVPTGAVPTQTPTPEPTEIPTPTATATPTPAI
ncbi:hypothetical protein A2Z33_06310 [Candidatus Gottesmanbacteria bacterium RBG_16_52_11]|uniref:DUF5666 domain-containing protein n=1 Tax=Candidatus Gottesmanbacteria bacterium RBG_16_52_11 TaxID=1798374 RepID=A0A1F5YXN0_9BACT|nr:MAG: hypothetical protein A2Z33_06310 [Candidatus Gottesmanbacteria bacterium RBG_16_52_11]